MSGAAGVIVLALLGGDMPPQRTETWPPVQACVVESIQVDGLAVVHHRWCIWDGRAWIPLISDEARGRVFGVRPGW